jgi:transcriptional antiterminator
MHYIYRSYIGLARQNMPEDETNSANQNRESPITLSELAALLGIQESVIRSRIANDPNQREYYSIGDLAERWRVSRGTVYNRLRSVGAKVLDFASPGKKGRKAVHSSVVLRIESQRTRRLC